MCLVALAIDQSRRFPLVIAANRDEFFARPTQRLGWWSPGRGGADILGGRDLQAGGTWLGLTTAGRLALLTNIRNPALNDPEAPSRGEIVPNWLRGDLAVDKFWMHTALAGYNGFNLVAADFQQGECFWANNQSPYPQRLGRGLYGLSNASLDTPWPKTVALKQRLRDALSAADSVETLSHKLFDALADRQSPPDDALPNTGVPLELERALSSAFIRISGRRYGTRASMLVITERTRKHLITHVLERSFGPTSSVALLRQSVLRDWPPRYEFPAPAEPASQGQVDEAEVALAPPQAPAPQRRHRTLLAPPPGARSAG